MKNSGEPINSVCTNNQIKHYGLTKREQFAGLALPAVISMFAFVTGQEDEIAKAAINVADALLAELDK